jgi:hypothetical protein
VVHRSIGKRVTDARDSQLRGNDDELIRQPQNPKALVSQPIVPLFVSNALPRDFVARSVDFDDERAAETYEVDNIVPEGDLPLKLGAFASSIRTARHTMVSA